ncbi:hypothetical protein ABTU92_29480, partial [Rhodoplanes sp. SY1]
AERRDDIVPLARHFLAEAAGRRPVPELDPAVVEFLLGRDYPGNVRDLRRIVAGLHARWCGEGPITIGAVPLAERPASFVETDPLSDPGFLQAIGRAVSRGVGLKEISRVAAGVAIRLALDHEGNNLKRAAQKLGVTDRALQLRRAGANGRSL